MLYESPAEVMEEITLLAPIYGGMFHDRLESCWGLQWPCWNRDHQGTTFLHKYFFTRGRGHFMPAAHEPAAELPDSDYPFVLNTGRIYHHYHTGTMTRQCHSLNRESAEARLQVNPLDATRLGLRPGDWVRLASRRGVIQIKTQLTEEVAPGSVYTTFHFPVAPINQLTNDARDPKAQCPEYKVCAVRLEKISP
jgi:formate dehydrogenase major subunit/formate dehydrogenase alpha subunit